MFDTLPYSDVLTREFALGANLGEMLLAFVIFSGFYVLRGVAGQLLHGILRRAAQRTATEFDDVLYAGLLPPARFLFLVAGVFLAFRVLHLEGEIALSAGQLLRSLLLYTLFWSFYNCVTLLDLMVKRTSAAFSGEVVSWGMRTLRGIIILLGATAILDVWGVHLGTLIAGLGLFGLAAALAAQDLFKNFLGGLAILAEGRFTKGDWIKVESIVEGVVEDIGFRSSKIARFDDAPVVVPNSIFSDHAVINFSQIGMRRIYWQIGLEYRTTAAQLRTICDEIKAWIKDSGKFVLPPDATLLVVVDGFSDSSIDLMLYCFTKTTKWGEWLDIKQDLALQIKEIVERNGAGFAFPSRALYVESLPSGEGAEMFTPPEPAKSKRK